MKQHAKLYEDNAGQYWLYHSTDDPDTQPDHIFGLVGQFVEDNFDPFDIVFGVIGEGFGSPVDVVHPNVWWITRIGKNDT